MYNEKYDVLNLYLNDLKEHILQHNSAISIYSIKLKNYYDTNAEYKEAIKLIQYQIASMKQESHYEKLKVDEERRQSKKERNIVKTLSCQKPLSKYSSLTDAYYTQRPLVSTFNEDQTSTRLNKEFTFGDYDGHKYKL
jgi:hypothetical protein